MDDFGERMATDSRSALDSVAESGAVPLVAAKEDFDRFYEREYRSIVAFAYVMTGDRFQAQDLAQEALVAAYQKWSKIDAPGAWVRSVVANRARSWFCRRYREGSAILRVPAPSAATPVAMAVEADDFWATVRSLPRRQAQSLALFYLEQWRVAEIAQVLGCAESTVRVHLTRGRKALADRLGAEVDL